MLKLVRSFERLTTPFYCLGLFIILFMAPQLATTAPSLSEKAPQIKKHTNLDKLYFVPNEDEFWRFIPHLRKQKGGDIGVGGLRVFFALSFGSFDSAINIDKNPAILHFNERISFLIRKSVSVFEFCSHFFKASLRLFCDRPS